MRTSQSGIALIKKFEGCRLEAYRDVVGKLTIGWGDTLNVQEGMRISQQEADDRLANRLAHEFEPGVMAAIQGAPVSQPQFDAMISLAWNIGVGRPLDHPEGPSGFTGSSVARFHRACDYAAAADAFLMWNKAGGRVLEPLQRRRAEERALYLSEGAQVQPDSKPPRNQTRNFLTNVNRPPTAMPIRRRS
jgi:lysozyme